MASQVRECVVFLLWPFLFFCAEVPAHMYSLAEGLAKRSPSSKERKKTHNPREGWEDGTPPPHRDFKERCVVR